MIKRFERIIITAVIARAIIQNDIVIIGRGLLQFPIKFDSVIIKFCAVIASQTNFCFIGNQFFAHTTMDNIKREITIYFFKTDKSAKNSIDNRRIIAERARIIKKQVQVERAKFVSAINRSLTVKIAVIFTPRRTRIKNARIASKRSTAIILLVKIRDNNVKLLVKVIIVCGSNAIAKNLFQRIHLFEDFKHIAICTRFKSLFNGIFNVNSNFLTIAVSHTALVFLILAVLALSAIARLARVVPIFAFTTIIFIYRRFTKTLFNFVKKVIDFTVIIPPTLTGRKTLHCFRERSIFNKQFLYSVKQVSIALVKTHELIKCVQSVFRRFKVIVRLNTIDTINLFRKINIKVKIVQYGFNPLIFKDIKLVSHSSVPTSQYSVAHFMIEHGANSHFLIFIFWRHFKGASNLRIRNDNLVRHRRVKRSIFVLAQRTANTAFRIDTNRKRVRNSFRFHKVNFHSIKPLSCLQY